MSYSIWKPIAKEHEAEPCVARCIALGYSFEYRIQDIDDDDDLGHLPDFDVRAMFDGASIGGSDFVQSSKCIHSQNIGVHAEHQKKGLGNAIYRVAELISGKVMIDFWGGPDEQTEAAKKLWASPHRCFGHNPPGRQ